MKSFWALPAFFCVLTMWAADAAKAADVTASIPAEARCLSSGDATEIVAKHQVVAPTQAIVLARRAEPNADVLRAALCRESDALVYRITVIRKDGRVVRVTVDAPSGKIKAVR